MLTDGPHVAPEWRDSDVIARRDFPRYKSTCKDAVDEGGGSETNHCTVPREVCKNSETGLGLSELCEKLWKASQCYSNQVLPGFSSSSGPEEASTVVMTE